MQTNFHKKLQKLKIRILSFPYTVKFVDDMLNKFHVVGVTSLYTGEINLEPDMTNLDIISSLIHELIETTFAKTETVVDHNVITKVEAFLMSLILENTELFEVILSEAKKEKSSITRG